MYAQLRLTALAAARVKLELEQLDRPSDAAACQFKLAYLDEQIESCKGLMGAEMAAFMSNMIGPLVDQIREQIERDIRGEDGD